MKMTIGICKPQKGNLRSMYFLADTFELISKLLRLQLTQILFHYSYSIRSTTSRMTMITRKMMILNVPLTMMTVPALVMLLQPPPNAAFCSWVLQSATGMTMTRNANMTMVMVALPLGRDKCRVNGKPAEGLISTWGIFGVDVKCLVMIT